MNCPLVSKRSVDSLQSCMRKFGGDHRDEEIDVCFQNACVRDRVFDCSLWKLRHLHFGQRCSRMLPNMLRVVDSS